MGASSGISISTFESPVLLSSGTFEVTFPFPCFPALALAGALVDLALVGALVGNASLEGALDKDGALDGALDKDGALDGTCALANGTAAAKQRMTTAMDSFTAIGWTRAFVDE